MTAALAVAVVVLVGWRCTARLGRIAADLSQLDRLVRGWQHAHDHQISELHRRLTGIEAAAMAAESSTRAVSELFVDLNAVAGAAGSAGGSGQPEVGERS